MTATMPTFLKVRIGEAIGDFEEVNAEPSLYNSFKRHRLKLKDGLLIDNLNLMKKDLRGGKSVLVVCNTVDQARKAFEQLNSDCDALLIHGKFTAEDRTNIEKKLDDEPPKLLVGTQAIEVSLNINYDVIYTESAPLDALIQRFGRVNRKGTKMPCPCIVFKERNEEDKYIYDQETVEGTWEVLEEIENDNEGLIKEAEIQKYIDQVYPCYNEKSQREFDKIYNLLTQSVKKLVPFEFSIDHEEDFYKQFDGIKVLPAYYEEEFRQRLEKFDFIGAEQLKVSIRKNWFARLIDTPDLECKSHILFPSTIQNAKSTEIQYYTINKKYRSLTGLELDVDEGLCSILS
jgi:CRISPR-associated endonuclease/helicase Cas3